MQFFNYKKISSTDDAFKNYVNVENQRMRLLAGGTTLIDLMKLEVETPLTILDINQLPFNKIDRTSNGGVMIGALVKNSDLAHDSFIQKNYAVLSQALLSGASAQLRNKATTGGNLLQRTRCVYFRDPAKACNKREPGSGCDAIEGYHRNLAILGTSTSCVASNPSDMNVAMMALGATIHIKTSRGDRQIAIEDFYRLPEKTPHLETALESGELIMAVSLAPLDGPTKSLYLKLRDRASYEFALASCAVVLKMDAAKIAKIRLAMGGVGSRPWREPAAEKMLEGQKPTLEILRSAADEFMKNARPLEQNKFKVELAKKAFVNAIQQTMAT